MIMALKKLMLALVVSACAVMPTMACSDNAMTKQEIAQLPQDQVQKIKNFCAQLFNDGNFETRIFCEDQQYKALRILMTRDN